LKKKIEAMEHGSEERKMGVRSGGGEEDSAGECGNGVIRTYLEWLTSIPCPFDTTAAVTSRRRAVKDRSS